jgi:outer membrane protein insertion porin family
MLYKAIALSTLAAIVASELSQQALANPNPTTAQPPSTARNYVVPVQGASETQASATVTAPEVNQTREFSQPTPGGELVAQITISLYSLQMLK